MTAPSEAPANDKAEGAKSNPVTASSSSSSGGEASVNDADVEAAGDLAQVSQGMQVPHIAWSKQALVY